MCVCVCGRRVGVPVLGERCKALTFRFFNEIPTLQPVSATCWLCAALTACLAFVCVCTFPLPAQLMCACVWAGGLYLQQLMRADFLFFHSLPLSLSLPLALAHFLFCFPTRS